MFFDSTLLRSAEIQPAAQADKLNFGRFRVSCEGYDFDEPIA